MGRKRGQKNKKGENEEKKPEEVSPEKEKETAETTASSSGNLTSLQPAGSDDASSKQKRKKGKKVEEKPDTRPGSSEQLKLVDSLSKPKDVSVAEEAVKQKQKKKQKDPIQSVTETDDTHSASFETFVAATPTIGDDKKKQKSTRKEQSDEADVQGKLEIPFKEHAVKSEPDVCETKSAYEVIDEDFPSFEFTTQQSRKRRKQRKEQPLFVETPPFQHQQVPLEKSKTDIKQLSSSEETRPKSTNDDNTLLHTEKFPTLEKKPSKSQRKGIDVKITYADQQSSKSIGLVGQFSQLQISGGDNLKKQPLPLQQTKKEDFELTIPHRKTRSGTRGRPIQIETNHLALTFRKLDQAVHYDVTITPSNSKKLFRGIMEEFRRTYYSNRYPAFDGTKNLYSSSELPFGLQITRDVTIYEGERAKQYKVAIKFANFVDLTPLTKFMTANPNGIHHMVTPQEVLQCLDIVLRSAPALMCLPVGRSYFTPPRDQILSLGSGMEMYYGFYQSAIIGWKPFLNIDVAHKAFPMRKNMIDIILDVCEIKREDLQRPLIRNHANDIQHFISNLKVRYEIPGKPATKREFRVNGIEKTACEATFKPENGSEITVEKYFLKEKKIVLKYPQMPCLWVGSRDRTPHILLPAELCTVIEGQVVNRNMSESLTSAMIKQTATSTKVRKEKIMDSVRKTRFNDDPCVREFGITVNEEFTKINARVLDPPALTYNERSVVKPAQGSWRPNKFLCGVTLSQWTIINLERNMRVEQLEDMARMLCTHAVNLGMSISQPQRPYQTLQLRYRKELQELEEVFRKKKDLQLIVVVVPNGGPYYSFVKQAAELAVGCLTQCIRSHTVNKMNASTIINILQKVNAKLEGINHVLNDRMDWMKRPFMIMGADVTHPSPDAKDKPSVAAVTASYDAGAFKYNICWRLQPPKVEIIEELEQITREQLLYFHTSTKYKPERIIFFRDGVSEGQFQYVLNTEIQAIRRACTCLQPDGTYKPKITFLVVQKRHHTRFFPINPQDASRDKNLNVPVGTCVDTEITHPTALDFCLVSHASIQGVARPTKYRVLWDDADMSEDDLEQLAFYFCHMFSRCTRSVSYPAPTYYAHLAAARIMAYCETGKLNMHNLRQEQERLCIKENIIKGRPMFFV